MTENAANPIEVYYLYKYDTKGISFRDETWEFVPDRSFATETEAREYIMEKSRLNPEFRRRLLAMGAVSAEAEQDFLREFCFGTVYARHCLYFIGKPIVRITMSLEMDDIQIKQLEKNNG
jgi:hypothetical protein